MVVVFGSVNEVSDASPKPLGFKAKVEFKTDFGVPGAPMGGSNECLFLFTEKRGYFNSPRYPANVSLFLNTLNIHYLLQYPLDTTCTYIIKAQKGEQILLYFEQFALYEENTKDECNDWLAIYDVTKTDNGTDIESLQGKYNHCN